MKVKRMRTELEFINEMAREYENIFNKAELCALAIATHIRDLCKPVVEDIECYVDGDTLYFYSDSHSYDPQKRFVRFDELIEDLTCLRDHVESPNFYLSNDECDEIKKLFNEVINFKRR